MTLVKFSFPDCINNIQNISTKTKTIKNTNYKATCLKHTKKISLCKLLENNTKTK